MEIYNNKGILGVIFRSAYSYYLRYFCRKRFPEGHIGKGSRIHVPSIVSMGSLDNIYLGNNVNIDWGNTLYCVNAKFVVGDNSGAAVGLTVVTGNHRTVPGEWLKERGNDNLEGKDVIVEEEVWLAANVTLLAGTRIGRGAIVAASSVVRGVKVPPYAIVAGNPCKIIGYRFTPEEIIEHEKALYPEEKRLPLSKLEKNYQKYFDNRAKIVEYISLY